MELKKLTATSNKSGTGGGARDLRLPWRAFRPIMHRIFTNDAIGRGGREIKSADVVYLDDNNKPQTTTLEYWPPTESRSAEDRISRVHASPALGGRLPDQDKGRIFFVLTKFYNGAIRCAYAYEDDLRAGKWGPDITKQILACVASSDASNGKKTVQGYYEFAKGTGYCHADPR